MSWKNYKKEYFSFEKILNIIKSLPTDHTISIGTDSQKKGDKIIFVTAICISAKTTKYHRKYFYYKLKENYKDYNDLYKRLIKETSISIEVSNDIKSICNKSKIEIHADININKKFQSSIYCKVIKGYISGCGFKFIMKPYSYAASSVADKYTKK